MPDDTLASARKSIEELDGGPEFLDYYAHQSKTAAIETIFAVLASVKRKIASGESADFITGGGLDTVRDGIKEIAASIVEMKQEVAHIQDPGDQAKIALATGELEAIVSATERATENILTASENISALADEIEQACGPQMADRVRKEYMDIVMACSFQDITGQRVQKVVSALRYIENRVQKMLVVLGMEDVSITPLSDRETGAHPEADLLEGPQHEGKAIDQSDVDRLFD